MPFCPQCGVEVDYDIENCPLCEFAVPPIPRNDPLARMEVSQFRNYYEELQKQKKMRNRKVKRIVFLTVAGLSLYSVFQVGFLDWFNDKSMSFSPYIMSSLILFVAVLYVFFGYARKGKHVFLILFLFISAYLLSLDLYDSDNSWFWDLGFPLTFVSLGISFCVTWIIRRTGKNWQYAFAAVLAGTGILCFLVELIIDLRLGNSLVWGWSTVVLFFVMPLALIFILLKKWLPSQIGERFRRYFHV